jgi:hypothetical protein
MVMPCRDRHDGSRVMLGLCRVFFLGQARLANYTKKEGDREGK